MILAAEHPALVLQLTRQLYAREARAGNDECEHFRPLQHLRLGGCFAEYVLYMPADAQRVIEGPDGERVFLDAGDSIKLRLASRADHQVIIGVATGL